MLKALVFTIITGLAWNQIVLVETLFDQQKNLTTVRLPSTKLSGPKDRYHSLSFSIDYSYPGETPSSPERVNFEVRSVVKARSLNPDLYVVFVADGEPVHFSSNRSAIRNPVRGRPWIGEKMVFLIPREDFLKLATAEKLAIKLGDVTFDFDNEARAGVQMLAKALVG